MELVKLQQRNKPLQFVGKLIVQPSVIESILSVRFCVCLAGGLRGPFCVHWQPADLPAGVRVQLPGESWPAEGQLPAGGSLHWAHVLLLHTV